MAVGRDQLTTGGSNDRLGSCYLPLGLKLNYDRCAAAGLDRAEMEARHVKRPQGHTPCASMLRLDSSR